MPEAVELNRRGLGLTDELRDREYEHIFKIFLEKCQNNDMVAMDYHLMWDRYRLILRNLVPDLRWVYLNTTLEMVEGRLNRPDHILSADFAKQVFEVFEPPSFPVKVVDASMPIEDVIRQVLA